ncbi:MAG: hypothetical protein QNK25_05810 [Desulfobacterales bacterium]|nr:hypothetical protein [Desulfobacterales bacterium]
MSIETKKKRIYAEREKIRHTTHWDMDYLPREAVERQYLKPLTGSGKIASQKEGGRQQRPPVGLVLIGVGAVLFAGAVLLGRFFSG